MKQDSSDNNALSLHGAVAVVTGASSGIGRAIALELARGGADVVVHARTNQEGAEETAEQVRALGRKATTLLADIADGRQRDELVAMAWSWRDRVDIWVNNAGADVLTGDAAGWTFDEKLAHLWRVDVAGTIAVSRLIGERMKAAGGGVILNIGWDQAEHGMEGDSGEMFAAVKGAVMAFTRSLAKSLAPQVRVNCLAPGWIRTSWGESASEYWQERAKSEALLQRWGGPEDVAQAARFLASPGAGYITGQIVAVNGGFAGRSTQRRQ